MSEGAKVSGVQVGSEVAEVSEVSRIWNSTIQVRASEVLEAALESAWGSAWGSALESALKSALKSALESVLEWSGVDHIHVRCIKGRGLSHEVQVTLGGQIGYKCCKCTPGVAGIGGAGCWKMGDLRRQRVRRIGISEVVCDVLLKRDEAGLFPARGGCWHSGVLGNVGGFSGTWIRWLWFELVDVRKIVCAVFVMKRECWEDTHGCWGQNVRICRWRSRACSFGEG